MSRDLGRTMRLASDHFLQQYGHPALRDLRMIAKVFGSSFRRIDSTSRLFSGELATEDSTTREQVDLVCKAIRSLTAKERRSVSFIENELIPFFGLNDEALHEQPQSLGAHFGKGLRLWQYPNQFARFLVHLENSRLPQKGYLEIGSRWCGTFLVISEWLFSGRGLELSVALDVISKPPIFFAYEGYVSENRGPELQYVQGYSNSQSTLETLVSLDFSTVFIDGDHSLGGALSDHLNFVDRVTRVVHHDIDSDAVPQLRILWELLGRLHQDSHSFFSFDQQYDEVHGSFLGIGVLEKTAFS